MTSEKYKRTWLQYMFQFLRLKFFAKYERYTHSVCKMNVKHIFLWKASKALVKISRCFVKGFLLKRGLTHFCVTDVVRINLFAIFLVSPFFGYYFKNVIYNLTISRKEEQVIIYLFSEYSLHFFHQMSSANFWLILSECRIFYVISSIHLSAHI